MARVTIEDCVKIVENRFELVVLGGRRAKDIAAGAPLSIERNNDKNPVIALREIAAQAVSIPNLRESFVRSLQKRGKFDEAEMELLDEDDNLTSNELVEDLKSYENQIEDDDFFDADDSSFSSDNLDIDD